jgi:hypothetical protein
VFLHKVSELAEAEAQHFGGASLDTAGTIERALEMCAFDVLQVSLEIERTTGIDRRFARTRGCRPA